MLPVPGLTDTDGEGLVDDAEFVIGTSATQRDTDGDGINDFTEVQQFLDPLSGRAVTTGVIASVPLQGEAKGILVAGSVSNADQQTAYVATGSFGLAIVDVSQFQQPQVKSQLDLPGDATDVALAAGRGIAVVAANAGGLHFVDVSDPAKPVLRQTLNVSTGQVEVFEGIAYAAIGTEVRRIR